MSKNMDEKALEVIFSCLDNRLFGAMIPIKPEKKEGAGLDSNFPTSFVGPIQLLPTISLHDIAIDETQITSPFRDPGDKGSDAGNLGMKYTARYGLYLGTGIYNPYRGKDCLTTNEDLKEFDDAMIHASSAFRTSTKTWCQPILYLRVMYNKDTGNGFRDLGSLISVETSEGEPPTGPKDVNINIDNLIEKLGTDEIKKVKGYVAPYAKELYPELGEIAFATIEDLSDDDKDYCCEYLWIIEVRHSNLNGDPLNDNRPRVFEGTEIGFATPERIKRWVRDYKESKDQPIFVSRNIPRQSAADRLLGMLEKNSDESDK